MDYQLAFQHYKDLADKGMGRLIEFLGEYTTMQSPIEIAIQGRNATASPIELMAQGHTAPVYDSSSVHTHNNGHYHTIYCTPHGSDKSRSTGIYNGPKHMPRHPHLQRKQDRRPGTDE